MVSEFLHLIFHGSFRHPTCKILFWARKNLEVLISSQNFITLGFLAAARAVATVKTPLENEVKIPNVNLKKVRFLRYNN